MPLIDISGLLPDLIEIMKILIIIIGAVIADKLVSRKLRSIARILHIEVETMKGIRFFFRFIILAVALVALASVKWFPSEYFVGAGAIIGTIIGLASATAISNFMSGASVLISRVIRIGDYVRIGDIEGVVTDISVNYTKIRTVDGSTVYVSNREISSKSILNYRVEKDGEELYVYPIVFSLDRSIPIDMVRTVIREMEKDIGAGLELYVDNITRLEIRYVVCIKVDDADKILRLKPMVLERIAEKFGG